MVATASCASLNHPAMMSRNSKAHHLSRQWGGGAASLPAVRAGAGRWRGGQRRGTRRPSQASPRQHPQQGDAMPARPQAPPPPPSLAADHDHAGQRQRQVAAPTPEGVATPPLPRRLLPAQHAAQAGAAQRTAWALPWHAPGWPEEQQHVVHGTDGPCRCRPAYGAGQRSSCRATLSLHVGSGPHSGLPRT